MTGQSGALSAKIKEVDIIMKNTVVPGAPLFRDPIYDGAADPVIIWNKQEQSWWIFSTNRRAAAVNHGVSYVN